jgi:hypothetical protein
MFAEHLAGYFTDFGETVTLHGLAVSAIFDDAGTTVLNGEVATTQPQITLTTYDVDNSGAVQGSFCIVRGVTYKVAIPPAEGRDGTGMSVLQLERQ